MRVLIITRSYAPDCNPRSFRWVSIAEYWTGLGHTVDVVCSFRAALPRYEQRNGVNIYRCGIGGFDVVRSFLLRVSTTDLGMPHGGDSHRGTSGLRCVIERLIKWVYERSWKKIYWPDSSAPWYFAAVHTASRLLSSNAYDGIISVSLPFTGHLVGLEVHRIHPQLPWVVDIGDPFSFMAETPVNNFALYSGLNRRWEKKVLGASTAISVTTEAAMQEYEKYFPEDSLKMTVIPPLLPPSMSELGQSPFPKGSSKIRMVFIGTLYRNIRNPNNLLALFSQLLLSRLGSSLELHFFGVVGDCGSCFEPYNHLLGTKIFIHGLVGQNIAFQAMKEAQVLVNIGNNTSYQLPSKIIEYASTGKPIINLTRSSVDSSAKLLADYPAMYLLTDIVCEGEIDKVVEFIESAHIVGSEWLDVWLRRFRIDSIAGAYEELLGGVADNS